MGGSPRRVLDRATVFSVGGYRFEGGPFHAFSRRGVTGLFRADRAAVAGLLPSPLLHPVPWGRSGTLVVVAGSDFTASLGSLPPSRYGEVVVAALVTYGEHPAPPHWPALSLLRSEYRPAWYNLAIAVTNRFARDHGRQVYGQPKRLADMRYEQREHHDRVLCHDDDALLLDLQVRTDGRPGDLKPAYLTAYAARDGLLLAWPMSMRGVQRTRLGPDAAQLTLGTHPSVQHLHSLGLSTTTLQGVAIPAGSLHISEHAEVVGSAQPPPAPLPTSLHRDCHLIISYAPGVDVEAGQHLDRLPFDPSDHLTVDDLAAV